jgi:hypothetical protein
MKIIRQYFEIQIATNVKYTLKDSLENNVAKTIILLRNILMRSLKHFYSEQKAFFTKFVARLLCQYRLLLISINL